MNGSNQPGTVPPPVPAGDHPVWLLGLVCLFLWQGWLALGLFGADQPWLRVLDDEPVVSGRHPLHLYHGYLGARALWERGSLSCYDPAFHAGYPKTPVFDSGSRPAELALALAGARYSPSAYKISLVVFCLLAPVCAYAACRSAGLSRGASVLGCLFGVILWWTQPGRQALEAGDVDLLLGSVLLMAQVGLLVRYHGRQSVLSLLGVVATGLLGWYAHPLLSALLLPLFLLYYLQVGPRHRLAWHVPLLLGLAAAVGANAFWLLDWVGYWWIRVTPTRETPLLARWTVQTLWESPLWGSGLDKGFACLLVVAGFLGAAVLYRSGRRLCALQFGLGALGLLLLAFASTSWEPFARWGANQLLVPALFFLILPASAALAALLGAVHRRTGNWASPAMVFATVPLVVALAAPQVAYPWAEQLLRPRPLETGLGEERTALLSSVEEHTTPEARILWEDRRGPRHESRWSALLPLLTSRSFVGGLDAEGIIEHAAGGLTASTLAGQPFGRWGKSDLEDYCRRYNVGWVVCWSAPACDLFRSLAGKEATPLPGGGWLVSLRRKPSYALSGAVRWRQADTRGILLADAVPEKEKGQQGQILLSLHYQTGMRVSPSRVRLEKAVDSQDSIPFVRLRMDEPVGRILITWEGR